MENKDAERFWKEKEIEKGSKLLIASAGVYITGQNGLNGPINGLLYLMGNGFYFENFKGDNWFTLLMKQTDEFDKVNIDIKRSDIKNIYYYNGKKSKDELSFLERILRLFGLIPRSLYIELKNNQTLLFNCVEDPLTICQKYSFDYPKQ